MRTPHVGLVLCSRLAQPIASTRIAIGNILPPLAAANIATTVLFEPVEPAEMPDLSGVAERAVTAGCNVVVLQKTRGESASQLARQLRAANISTIFVVCDRVDEAMAEVCDMTLVVTDFMKSTFPLALQERIRVMHDGIENPDVVKRAWSGHRGSLLRPLRAVLVTGFDLDNIPAMGEIPAWLNVRVVGRYGSGLAKLKAMRRKWIAKRADQRLDYLQFLATPQISCIPWSAERVYRELPQADIGIIPIDKPPRAADDTHPEDWIIKSENRLTLKMAVGLPVIATPIPSYEAVIRHGENGFLARSAQDWRACLDALRDPARRRAVGQAARASVIERYSTNAQADIFIAAVRALL